MSHTVRRAACAYARLAVINTHPVFIPSNIIQFSAACVTATLPLVGLGVLYRYVQVSENSEAGPPIASH